MFFKTRLDEVERNRNGIEVCWQLRGIARAGLCMRSCQRSVWILILVNTVIPLSICALVRCVLFKNGFYLHLRSFVG